MGPPISPHASRTDWLTPLLLGTLHVVLGLVLFTSTGRDDSHITYWAARQLATTGDLVNYNGEAVEQSSSLLHVIVLAALARVIPLSIPTLGGLLSAFAGGLTVIATYRLLVAASSPAVALAGGMLIACSGPLLYWSYGGLETTLVAAVAGWMFLSFVQVYDNGWTPGRFVQACAVVLAYLLVRPEAILVLGGTLAVVLAVLTHHSRRRADFRPQLRRVAGFFGLALALFAVLAMSRLAYTGSVFPQPVEAKAGAIGLDTMMLGARYVRSDIVRTPSVILWFLAVAGAATVMIRAGFRTPPRSLELVVAAFTLVCLAFVLLAGGDWMEAGRFLVPILPSAIVTALLFVTAAAPRVWHLIALLLVCLEAIGTVDLARHASTGGPIWAGPSATPKEAAEFSMFEIRNRIHYRDVWLLGPFESVLSQLHARGVRQVTIFTGHMGMVPYYLAQRNLVRVRLLDMYSLTSPVFTDCQVTADRPRRRLGTDISFQFFFTHLDELREKCDVPTPEIVFGQDLNGPGRQPEDLEAAGFTVVHSQSGAIENGSRWFPGDKVTANEFIAVRNDLVELLKTE